MPKFIKFVAPPACAALLVPVCFPQQSEVHYSQFVYVAGDLSAREPVDQPHNHNSENEPVEISVLAPSMYTNTSATTQLIATSSTEWVMESKDSTFDTDKLFGAQLSARGIMLHVEYRPSSGAAPAAVS